MEGWHITVYSDESCTQKVGTLITNEDGRAGYYLDPGTYWAKETGDEHGLSRNLKSSPMKMFPSPSPMSSTAD